MGKCSVITRAITSHYTLAHIRSLAVFAGVWLKG